VSHLFHLLLAQWAVIIKMCVLTELKGLWPQSNSLAQYI